MWHAFWLPKPPGGCNVRAHNPDGSKPDTCAREGRRLSSDIDARAHPTIEQDAQAASAAQLEGEESRRPAKSEQTAAPETPSTFFNTSSPSATPADFEVTAQSRRSTRTDKPSCIEHDSKSGGTEHQAPTPLASRPACKSLVPSRKTRTKQGE